MLSEELRKDIEALAGDRQWVPPAGCLDHPKALIVSGYPFVTDFLFQPPRPMTGAAGEVLNRCFARMSRMDVKEWLSKSKTRSLLLYSQLNCAVTYAVKVRYERPLSSQEAHAWAAILSREISELGPDECIPLGSHAQQMFAIMPAALVRREPRTLLQRIISVVRPS